MRTGEDPGVSPCSTPGYDPTCKPPWDYFPAKHFCNQSLLS